MSAFLAYCVHSISIFGVLEALVIEGYMFLDDLNLIFFHVFLMLAIGSVHCLIYKLMITKKEEREKVPPFWFEALFIYFLSKTVLFYNRSFPHPSLNKEQPTALLSSFKILCIMTSFYFSQYSFILPSFFLFLNEEIYCQPINNSVFKRHLSFKAKFQSLH